MRSGHALPVLEIGMVSQFCPILPILLSQFCYILIVMQPAIPGPVTPTRVVMQPGQKRQEQLEVLETLEVLLPNLGF